jgi:hypothetical protein
VLYGRSIVSFSVSVTNFATLYAGKFFQFTAGLMGVFCLHSFIIACRLEAMQHRGIHKLSCLDCPKKYINQMRQTFNARFEEHIHVIRNNRPDTGYSQHILGAGHTRGNMEYAMKIIRKAKK